MAKTDTLILSFGEATETKYGKILVEIDPERHADKDGNVQNRFREGEEVFFLINKDAGLSIVRVRDTADGHVQRIGEVTRTGQQEKVTFTHYDDAKTLSHIAESASALNSYGRKSSVILQADNSVKAPLAPCLLDISYSYRAILYRYRPPSMSLALEEEFPVDLVIEYKGGNQ